MPGLEFRRTCPSGARALRAARESKDYLRWVWLRTPSLGRVAYNLVVGSRLKAV